MKLGLVNIITPIEDMDGTIVQILQDITIPVFSIYQPYKETIHLNMQNLELIERLDISEKYSLPDFKTRKLLYVFDVRYESSMAAGLGFWGGGIPLSAGSTVEAMLLKNACANVMNLMIPKITFNFTPPREIELFHAYYSSALEFDFGFEHDKTLASIPETARESFLELALLDVKENLYPTLKNYSEIQTAIGTINLKIDDWANAEDQRKELINRWDDSYHLDFQPFYWA
jgi:hypothetical protein